MKHTKLAAVLVAGLMPIAVQAKIITIKLAGSVEYLYGVTRPAFSIGQSARAVLSYDTTSPGYNFYPGQAVQYYPNAPTIGYLLIDRYKIVLDTARMFVTDNESDCCGGKIDRLIYEDNSPIGGAIGGLAVNNLFFNWQAPGSSGTGVALPSTPASLVRYGLPTAALDYSNNPDDNGSSNRVQLRFTSINASVPEPTSWMLLISGFVLIGIALRGSYNSARRYAARDID